MVQRLVDIVDHDDFPFLALLWEEDGSLKLGPNLDFATGVEIQDTVAGGLHAITLAFILPTCISLGVGGVELPAPTDSLEIAPGQSGGPNIHFGANSGIEDLGLLENLEAGDC